MKTINLNGENLTIEDIINVAYNGYKVSATEEAKEKIKKSRKVVDGIVERNDTKYGITTGFGKFSDVTISGEECKTLQKNLIMSHSCGAGRKFPKEVVRTIMLLRANNLVKGYSGIRLSVFETLLDMLNKGVHPCIPEKGSLGASGDLAPLAHMVLPMLGEGEAEFQGEILPGKEAMEKAGIATVELVAKEGLALINGTQVMTAVGSLALYKAINLLKVSDITAALTIEALRGVRDAFDLRTHMLRPHAGQIQTAKNINALTEGSSFMTNQGDLRVQDAYTLRCVPQVHGASKDAVNYVKNKVEIEINSVTDNPIIFDNADVISGGNFHGQPMALSFDFLGIAMSEVANISERRLERLVNYQLNDLPPFLAKNGGLNSGFMITQYAAAALVSENKVLAHPASVDSISSSANQEDHVSMGTIAARKSLAIVNNATRVVATELMAACQAIDFRDGLKLGKGTQEAYNVVRNKVSFIEKDKIMYKELEKCDELITSGELLKAVEEKVNLGI
ncbi:MULTISPECIES: histidine ammonia-lyase [Clostridium]|uniref:Histidine ammonia-lyase n=3 Tax=Clostridium TaxID=1485 RepID=D8GJP5_CLOLD|nr:MULTISPECIES: histidine ammonia-lyase [Clostridium]ADK15206.1 histidine ammonia-lyase [Clostridium ljungdahlii DSM 13528]AGY74465.1 histidine ammonia-lyase [Clostridium autoethanogenum DSM 10061]ALU34653.1 Histidine ammonia-lyase [Clostridium autoethanogenum DSM 10061]OAA88686.1 Histidine ammonia-lyase [Clostridium ljungdahlii DSM 13528]OVY51373.1 Histidine ammonia-lyase [Clostridium autoethanogenum]